VASGHNGDIHRAAYGYEPTRDAAMAAFARSWRKLRGNRAALTEEMNPAALPWRTSHLAITFY
jgi:hypothetical protein